MKIALIVIVEGDEEMGYQTPEQLEDAVKEAMRNYDESLVVEVSQME